MATYTNYSLRIGSSQLTWTMRDRTPEERAAAEARAALLDRRLLVGVITVMSVAVLLPTAAVIALWALGVR